MIVLDTHAWLWWLVDPTRLSDPAREAIDAASRIGIPAISCLEIATLHDRGRIRLRRPVGEWIAQALAYDRVDEMPLTAAIAVEAGTLDRNDFPTDPADRIIYSTARVAGARLVSADRAIKAFDAARVVW